MSSFARQKGKVAVQRTVEELRKKKKNGNGTSNAKFAIFSLSSSLPLAASLGGNRAKKHRGQSATSRERRNVCCVKVPPFLQVHPSSLMSHLGHTEEKKQRGEDKKKKKEASKQKLEPKKKLQQTKEEKKEDKVNKKEVKKEPNKEEKEEVKKEPKKEGKRESDKKRLVRTDGVYCCLQAEGASSHRVLRFCADGKTVKYYGNITSHRELDGKHQYRYAFVPWFTIDFSLTVIYFQSRRLLDFDQLQQRKSASAADRRRFSGGVSSTFCCHPIRVRSCTETSGISHSVQHLCWKEDGVSFYGKLVGSRQWEHRNAGS